MRKGVLLPAMAICRRILEGFPKHIDTYALLGQICMQRDQTDLAIDLFQRVLSVDPEHPTAYVSLARIYADRGELKEALWHLERAFELVPGSHSVRRELSRLYQENNMPAPGRIKLSRAALARVYMRGQLYDKAVLELRQLLAEAPQRYDLKVALAEALWHDERYEEAADACQEILADAPDCLKANLILGEVWLSTDRDEVARVCLQVAQEIDPGNTVAQSIFSRRSPLALRTPRLAAREEDFEPVDLPYLQIDDEAEEEVPPSAGTSEAEGAPSAADSPEPGARIHTEQTKSSASRLGEKLMWLLKRSSTTLAKDSARASGEVPPRDPAQGAAGLAADTPILSGQSPDDEPVEGLATHREDSMQPDEGAPRDGMSLLDIRLQFVQGHPDDWQARLDLARSYRDLGHLEDALVQYEFLVNYDYEAAREATRDLDFLNRIYPGTPKLVQLLVTARERESQQPPSPQGT